MIIEFLLTTCFALFFSGLGIFFSYVSIALLLVTRRVRLKGRLTSGLVVKKRQEVTRISGRNINNYYAQIAYEVDGKTYMRDLSVTHATYESWSDGQAVDIQYLHDKPEMGFLPNDNEPTDMPIGGLIAAIVFLGVAVLFWVLFVNILGSLLH